MFDVFRRIDRMMLRFEDSWAVPVLLVAIMLAILSTMFLTD